MSVKYLPLITSLLFLLVLSCCTKINTNYSPRETVIPTGYTLKVLTQYGELKIEAISDTERCYTWDGHEIKTKLIPRRSRWYGKLGLHGQVNPPQKDVVSMIVGEYQSHYKSKNHLEKYLNVYPGITEIYNDSGLLVRFIKETSPKGLIAIDITVTQMLINGVKPETLHGSKNDNIIMIKNT